MNTIKQAEQVKADIFWETHFGKYQNQSLNEEVARETEFWDQLRTTLESVDIDILYAVMLANPAIKISESNLHVKIVRIAKRIWDKKRDSNT